MNVVVRTPSDPEDQLMMGTAPSLHIVLPISTHKLSVPITGWTLLTVTDTCTSSPSLCVSALELGRIHGHS